jgi:VCBS repeat-containing protein
MVITVAAPGLSAAAYDAENDPITIHVDTPPSYGQLTLNPDGSISYQPDDSFSGEDTFTYTASDGIATSSPATVTIISPIGAATPPTGAVTVFAGFLLNGSPEWGWGVPVPQAERVTIIAPTDIEGVYYNYWANLYNAGMVTWPFAGSPGPGIATFKDPVITLAGTANSYLGTPPNMAFGFSGTYLIPFANGGANDSGGFVVQEYWLGWRYGLYYFSNP